VFVFVFVLFLTGHTTVILIDIRRVMDIVSNSLEASDLILVNDSVCPYW